MFKGSILVLTSVLALVTAQPTNIEDILAKAVVSLKNETIPIENIEELNDEKVIEKEIALAVEAIKEAEHQDLLVIPKEVEEDIKQWINSLDCYNSEMNIMKCLLIKKYYARISKNPPKEFTVMKERAKLLLEMLKEDAHTDKTLRKLIKKHGHLFN